MLTLLDLEIEALAGSVDDSEEVYFVPALSGGLLAPYWRSDAKGAIIGMTLTTDRRHIIRFGQIVLCFSAFNQTKNCARMHRLCSI